MATDRETIDALRAEVERLQSKERANAFFRDFVVGEGAYERFNELTDRATRAEAEVFRLQGELLRSPLKRVQELSAEAVTLRSELAESRHDYEIQSQYVEALKVRVAGLSRDAERYRWLRLRIEASEISDETTAIADINLYGVIGEREPDPGHCEELDAAIDAAMAGEAGDV